MPNGINNNYYRYYYTYLARIFFLFLLSSSVIVEQLLENWSKMHLNFIRFMFSSFHIVHRTLICMGPGSESNVLGSEGAIEFSKDCWEGSRSLSIRLENKSILGEKNHVSELSLVQPLSSRPDSHFQAYEIHFTWLNLNQKDMYTYTYK